MHATGIYPLDEILPNRAVGYYRVCKQNKCDWKNNYFQVAFSGTAAGGSYSTVENLFNFSQFLHGGKLLNSNFTRLVLSPEVIQTAKNNYVKNLKIGDAYIHGNFSPYGFAGAGNKFGFAIWHNPTLMGHTGGTFGAPALFLMSPQNDYTIIILSNMDGGMILLYKKIREGLDFKGIIENL